MITLLVIVFIALLAGIVVTSGYLAVRCIREAMEVQVAWGRVLLIFVAMWFTIIAGIGVRGVVSTIVQLITLGG